MLYLNIQAGGIKDNRFTVMPKYEIIMLMHCLCVHVGAFVSIYVLVFMCIGCIYYLLHNPCLNQIKALQ